MLCLARLREGAASALGAMLYVSSVLCAACICCVYLLFLFALGARIWFMLIVWYLLCARLV